MKIFTKQNLVHICDENERDIKEEGCKLLYHVHANVKCIIIDSYVTNFLYMYVVFLMTFL